MLPRCALRSFALFSVVVLTALLVGSCSGSSGSSADAASACLSVDCGDTSSAGRPSSHLSLDAGTAGKGAAASFNLLCGAPTTGCDPDSAESCSLSTASASGGVASSGGASGSAGAAGAGGASASTGGLVGGGVSDPVPSTGACRVQRRGSVTVANCGRSGTGRAGQPCVSSADCAGGLACVDEGGIGQCRAYCCKGSQGCGGKDFCDVRVARAAEADLEHLLVPVCVESDNCQLGDVAACSVEGRVCSVVGPQGATSCVTPGSGTVGKPCPCAEGFVCSESTGTCLQLCPLTGAVNRCSPGACQSSSGLPMGWGLCVAELPLTR